MDLCIVQQPSQTIEKHSTKNPPTQKATKEKPKHNQNKQHTQTKQTDNKENDRRSSPGTSDECKVITLYQLRYWYGRKQSKRKRTNTNITLPYRRVSEATQSPAETRDPPSQDPQDHIEQAIRHNNSHKPKHHFDASNSNAMSQLKW